jgi:uncharacterized membrane protein YeaQ/YmgE (transglycosylase-associated protein family)
MGIITTETVLFIEGNSFDRRNNLMNIVLWLISGVIAGWLTGLIMKGGGYGLIGDLVIGLLGGVIGGYLAGLLGVQASSWIAQILVAVAGGVVLVVVLRAIKRV